MREVQRLAESVRAFNRFYTRQIGLLGKSYLDSPFSLTEVRALYELAHRGQPTATELANDLGLDPGYLSRILLSFENRGLLARRASESDGRSALLSLTARGRKTFAPLETKSRGDIVGMIEKLKAPEQRRLADAMATIQALLGAPKESPGGYVLRPHRPGDIGWVVHRHGALYAQEYGWDERFEALVAEIAAKFVQNFDPKRERCWIAERDGEIAGSVFLVKASEDVAKLRLLLVEPSARGCGIGGGLVDECIRFARQAGYRKITLWTQSMLTAARRIYKRAGFRIVHKERQNSFGPKLTAETWELTL
jgi:DNA-binding MarR family transcriptional regulator/N-acetylglutamate synthase-like GNAT family acetyltransferase